MKYRFVLSLAAVLLVGGFITLSTQSAEAQVTKVALDKAAKGDFSLLQKQAKAGNVVINGKLINIK